MLLTVSAPREQSWGQMDRRTGSCTAPADSTQGLGHTSPKLLWAPAYGWSSSPRKYDHDSVDTSIPIDSHVACSAQERKTLSAHWMIYNTPTQASMQSRQNSEEHSLSLHWRAALHFTDPEQDCSSNTKAAKSSAFQEGTVKSNAFQEEQHSALNSDTRALSLSLSLQLTAQQFLNHPW